LDAEDEDIDRLLAFKLRQQHVKLEPGYDEDGNKKMNNSTLKQESTEGIEASSESGSVVFEA
jgi:hypothetical protein